MRNIVFILLCCIISNVTKAQQQNIEDFRPYYLPDPELYLKDFIPAGFTRIDHLQALAVIDAFFMEVSGKIATSGYTGPEVNYYQKGDVVMSCAVYNDSIKWHIQQSIMPELQLPMPGGDPYAPIQVQDKPTYWNPYHSINSPYMIQYYLLDYFGFYWLNGELLPGISSEYRRNNSLDVAYAYPNGSPQTVKTYSALMAFDKSYRYNVEIRVFSVNAHRVDAVNALKWIAEHMEVNDSFQSLDYGN